MSSPRSPKRTSGRAASRANRSRSPASEPPQTTSGIFGQFGLTSFVSIDPDFYSLRTSQGCLLSMMGESSVESSATWPQSGMWSSGRLYLPQTSERPTSASDCGSGPNTQGQWPTPSSQEPGIKHREIVDKNGNPPKGHNERWYDKETGRLIQKGLTQAVIRPSPRIPTPDANCWKGSAKPGQRRRQIDEYVAHRIPTPTGGDAKSSGSRNTEGSEAHPGHGRSTRQTWSTPRSSDVEQGGGDLESAALTAGQTNGQLHPCWVEWLMGFPIGWTVLDASETPSFRRSSRGSQVEPKQESNRIVNDRKGESQ